MVRKDTPTSWAAYIITMCCLFVFSVIAFCYGYLFKDWPQAETRLSLEQSLQCFTPIFPNRCTDYILDIGGIPPVKMFIYQLIIFSPLLAMIIIVGLLFWYHFIRTKERVIHSGLTVGGMDDLLSSAKSDIKFGKFPDVPGLHMFNGWHLAVDRETKHFNIIGGIGGGKTILMSRLINSAVLRNDKVLIFDQKGDYTSIIPPNNVNGKDYEPIILSPTDERSAVWNVAADLVVAQEATELANRLIARSNNENEFFVDSARAILAACIVKLMATNPNKWTWKDLLAETRTSQDDLLATALKYQCGTHRYLEADFKQVMSSLSSLESKMAMLNMLATAWPTYDNRQLFSIRDWLKDTTKFGTVIIKHDGQFSALSDGWISSLYAIAINTVTDSKAMSDSDLRRVWFFLDEWAQLPKIDQFQTFVTVGRSKGVCVVSGLQDAAQVSEKYGADALKTLMASVGTTMIVHINHGETALTLERYFGKTTYSNWSQRPYGGNGGMQWTEQRVEEAPFKSTEFSTELWADKKGVRCLVSGLGQHLYKVLVPMDKTFSKSYRVASLPAEWTKTFVVHGTLKTDEEIEAYIYAVRRREKGNKG